MSTIAGIIFNDQQPDAEQKVQTMLAAMADRAGLPPRTQNLGPACFGCSLFATVPANTTCTPPIVCRQNHLMLTGDVRLDNRTELAHRLNQDPSQYSDPELLLQAWKQWGIKTPEYLIGDYAFTLWDNSEQELFCVRDRFGVKPLFYTHTSKYFAFASEIKALKTLAHYDVDEHVLAAYILVLLPDARQTFFKGIQRLLPATTLRVHGQAATPHTYWRPQDVAPITFPDTEEYAQAFREIFSKAVQCRIQSTGPVGSTLSGGLDSSSIVCTAAPMLQQQGRELFTYSAVFSGLQGQDAKKVDEAVYRQAVLDHVDVRPRIVDVGTADIYQRLDQELDWLDAPFFNPNLYIHRGLYAQAREDGLQIFLDGIDGDTVVSHGYELLPQLFLSGRWRKLHWELQQMKQVSNSRQPLWRLAASYAVKPVLQWLLDSPLVRTALTLPKAGTMLAKQVATQNSLLQLLRESATRTRLPVVRARSHHQAALALPHLMFALETSNQVASRYGLEERYPFLDSRLVEFCLAIPSEQKFHNGWSRAILRRAMATTLPANVRRRLTKANLSPVFMQQTQTTAKELLAAHLAEKEPALLRYMAASYTRKLLDPARFAENNLHLYSAVCLLKWLEKNIR